MNSIRGIGKSAIIAAIPFAIGLTTSAELFEGPDENASIQLTAESEFRLEHTDWIIVSPSTPILVEDAFDADVELKGVGTKVANFTRNSGNGQSVDPTLLATYLQQVYPQAGMTLTTFTENYRYYVDEDGYLVRVCSSNAEITLDLGLTGGPIIVELSTQVEV